MPVVRVQACMHSVDAQQFALIALSQRDWLVLVALFCAVVVFGNGLHFIAFRLLGERAEALRKSPLGIHRYLAAPSRAVLLTVGVLIALPFVPGLNPALRGQVEQYIGSFLVLLCGWLAIGAVYVMETVTLRRFDMTAANNLRARRVHTQMQFFRRLLIGLVLILTAGAFLWSFHDQRLWQFGSGILASAGLASLVLAAAAKSTASNLIAGMQIAFTEPIRIDDVVVVSGEWGRIAEITSTYVVVNIWDQRTLIVPISYFIEQPFANWTRRGSEIMGTAFLYVDYAVPVEPLRTELRRIAESTPLWDGRVCGLQVTDLREHTMELRCLISSADSGKNFDLRCLVREKMMEFVRDRYPHALPTMRVDMAEAAPRKSEPGPLPPPIASQRDDPMPANQIPNPLESTGSSAQQAAAEDSI